MIQSNIKEIEYDNLEFPCLGKGNNGLVVLFHDLGSGTVVHGNHVYTIGHYSTSWVMDTFTPFKGTVKLKHK